VRLYDLMPGFSALTAVGVQELVRPAAHRDRITRRNGLGVPAACSGMSEMQAQKAAVVAVGSPAVDVPGLPSRGSPL
jgi:hypothetical protein